MSNVLLAYPNRIDTSTLSGGAWQPSLPLSNLQVRELPEVARTADATLASTQFTINLGKLRSVRVVALAGHTISITGKIRIRIYADGAFTTLLYDSGWLDVWPSIYPFGSVPWDDPRFWDGKPTAEDLAGITWLYTNLLPAAVVGQYIKVEINDTANPDGFISIGRAFVASQFQPAINMSWGASIGYEDKTPVAEALSGTEYFDQRQPYRIARVKLDWLSEAEGFGTALDMQRRQGISGEVLYMYDPDDTTYRVMRSFLGRMRMLSAIEAPSFGRTATAYEIKEIL